MIFNLHISDFCYTFARNLQETGMKTDNKRFVKAGLLGILMLLTATGVHGQWRVGVSGGGVYNWYSIDTRYQTDFHYDGEWGWNAAVFGQYNFLPWLGLRAEIEAIEKSYRFYRTGMYAATNYTTRNTYIQLPVMAEFRFGGALRKPGMAIHGFVHAGVYAGYWAAGHQRGTICNPMTGKTEKVNQAYPFMGERDRRADFGPAGGIGLEYQPAAHWAIHVEGRCYYGMISTVKPYMEVRDSRYHTTVGIQTGVSYVF